jgi:hypothetical protein
VVGALEGALEGALDDPGATVAVPVFGPADPGGPWSASASPAPRGLPHVPQNRSPGSLADPQTWHWAASCEPHARQNRRSGRFSVPHALHRIVGA